jgi:RimJ/RimL family protein N-acetyltransferase
MSRPTEQRYLDQEGRVTQWPSKHQDKLLVLAYLASKFKLGLIYTEPQVNELLKHWHTFNDWPLLRRELYDHGFLDRHRDGTGYRLKEVATELPELTLVQPDIERDAPAGVRWLEGETGRDTLRLMGNPEKHNKPSTLEEERQRVRNFIISATQRTWMIRYQQNIIGAVWIDLTSTNYLAAPSVHIMIGDPAARGKGIGGHTIRAIINLLEQQHKFTTLHSRHLVENIGSARLLAKLGFQTDGNPYADDDGLRWQNVHLTLSTFD